MNDPTDNKKDFCFKFVLQGRNSLFRCRRHCFRLWAGTAVGGVFHLVGPTIVGRFFIEESSVIHCFSRCNFSHLGYVSLRWRGTVINIYDVWFNFPVSHLFCERGFVRTCRKKQRRNKFAPIFKRFAHAPLQNTEAKRLGNKCTLLFSISPK